MRIVVFSDSHGSLSEMTAVVKKEKIDMLMHVGDMAEDIDRLVERLKLNVPVYRVRGNCDYNTLAERELMVDVLGVKILLVHGNRQAVKTSTTRLYYYALEKGADVVVFGHTHHPYVNFTGDLHLLNPGTIAVPHGMGKSYGVIEIEAGEKPKIDIKTVRL